MHAKSAAGPEVVVAIHAEDAITHSGLASCLRSDGRLVEAAPGGTAGADVIVVAVEHAQTSFLGRLRSLSSGPSPLFVCVVGTQWHVDMSAAVEHGVRAVLWRDEFTAEAFTRAVRTVALGGGAIPPGLQGTLLDQVQRVQREVLSPRGLTASELDGREVDVLRLLSDGLDLREISRKMSYSERTVKNILYGAMKRLGLHSRTHAVAHALRAGLI